MEAIIGKTIKGRYRVDALLGRGGMAEVYKVWDQDRSVDIAMKVLRQDIAYDPVFLRRFQREAQSLSELQHPNIVRFYGLEREKLLTFLLMEFVDGYSLQAEILLAEGKPLPDKRILDVLDQICSALSYAHKKGLVHCDIKPGNIMLERNGERVLLTDFGIARTIDAATSTLVGAGTPAYMPPELIKGLDPKPQSDIYSLGIVLYEMLTGGERPFTGEHADTTGTTADKVRWEHLHLQAPLVSELNPKAAGGMDKIVAKCLEKNPQQRFERALEVYEALADLLSGGLSEGKPPLRLKEEPKKDDSSKPKDVPEKPVVSEKKDKHRVYRETKKKPGGDKKPSLFWSIILLIAMMIVVFSAMCGLLDRGDNTLRDTIATPTKTSRMESVVKEISSEFFLEIEQRKCLL